MFAYFVIRLWHQTNVPEGFGCGIFVKKYAIELMQYICSN